MSCWSARVEQKAHVETIIKMRHTFVAHELDIRVNVIKRGLSTQSAKSMTRHCAQVSGEATCAPLCADASLSGVSCI